MRIGVDTKNKLEQISRKQPMYVVAVRGGFDRFCVMVDRGWRRRYSGVDRRHLLTALYFRAIQPLYEKSDEVFIDRDYLGSYMQTIRSPLSLLLEIDVSLVRIEGRRSCRAVQNAHSWAEWFWKKGKQDLKNPDVKSILRKLKEL